jgi:hypothetical protein
MVENGVFLVKVLPLCILFTIQAMSFDIDTASKIFNKIFTAIFSKQIIYVYSPNPDYIEVVHKAENLDLTQDIIHADIVLLTNTEELAKAQNRLAFTVNLTVLKEGKRVIGAFYWEYGRPKIVFIRKRLEYYDITLAKPFEKYIVEELP